VTLTQIYDFLNTHNLAVISTSNQDVPEAALIGFGQTKDLTLIFGTSTQSRKYQNLQTNTRVALVIGWGEDSKTVQYEGIATELNKSDVEELVGVYHAKVPAAVRFQNDPDQTYFKVKPIWLRFSCHKVGEEAAFEFQFDDVR